MAYHPLTLGRAAASAAAARFWSAHIPSHAAIPW